eukprot:CAMPEP_0170072194 /NCGR_PEP_ID=MMETSP0019_2-20121128/9897_1 /TAXON_ID=98059 /ORGANISM="Dinobryon sp., Strain UTEXLB2267" /LENGTH=556 /DNA_ID=CAMNT_0010281051 /DNA_START=143 /DNA_END=1813 /DNA_ORIENTATION=-
MKESPSRRDFRSVVQRLLDLRITLCVDGENRDDFNEVDESLKYAPRQYVSRIEERLNFDDDLDLDKAETAYPINVDFKLLKSIGKNKFQSQVLNPISSQANATDKNSIQLKTFGNPKEAHHYNNHVSDVYSLNAKLDFSSNLGPLALEIEDCIPSSSPIEKGDSVAVKKRKRDSDEMAFDIEGQAENNCSVLSMEVITLALSRLFVLRSVYAQLSKAIVFAVGTRSAWIVIFERQLEDDERGEYIHMYRIRRKSVSPLWSAISLQMKMNSKWFLTEDAEILNEAIMHLGVHPIGTVSQLVECSGHRVYGVSFPRIYSSYAYWSTSALGCTANVASFAIKIFHREVKFRREAQYLERVKEQYHKLYEEDDICFYMLATGEVDTSKPSKVIEEVSHKQINDYTAQYIFSKIGTVVKNLKLRSKVYFPEKCWDCLMHSRSDNFGGYILMRYGHKVHIDESNKAAIADSVMKSLEAAHAVGIVHCDIRPSNILRFEDEADRNKYQLIDFGHAVDTNDEVKFRDRIQYECRGRRFRRNFIGDKVSWGTEDDYQMLVRMLLG